jgi:general secretion pathway protein J
LPRRAERGFTLPRRAERGFTLIELMVALALVGALLALLFSGIGLGVKSMSRLDDQVARIDARRSLAFALRREIAATYTASEGAAATATFVGQPSTLSFLSLGAGAAAGFTRVWLMLEPGGPDREGPNLVLMRRPQAPGLWFGFERVVLARGVAGFRLAYFGAPTATEPPAWRDHWEGFRSPPELVRISLTLASDGGYAWPDAVVRIWTTAGAMP